MLRVPKTKLASSIVRPFYYSSRASLITIRQFNRPFIMPLPITIATLFSKFITNKVGLSVSLQTIAILRARVKAFNKGTNINSLLELLPFSMLGIVGEDIREE
jgi:hypothetical protein